MDRQLTPDRKFTVRVSSPGQCQRVLEIEIPEEELAQEREAVTRELRRELRVPGFRKGKVPLDHIKRNYANAIRGDAVRNLLPHVYEMAVIQEGLVPLGEPRFENMKAESGEGLQFEAHIEVRPDIEVKGYDSVAIEAQRREVGDVQVTEAIERLRERMATYRSVDRAASATDYMVIDYAPIRDDGTLDEAARQKGQAVELSGEHLLEELKVGLVGMKSGDEKDISLTYQDDHADPALAGARRTIRVTAVEVKEKLLPELDDAFAKRMGEKFETLESLRQEVRTDLEQEEKKRFEHEVRERIIDRLIEQNPFEVPQVMVANYIASITAEDRRRRPQVEDETKREQEIGEMFHDAAVRTIKKFLIMDAVRRQENLSVTDADVEERIQALSESTGRPIDEIREQLKHPENRRSFENELLDEKVLNLLRENVDIKAA